MMNASMFGNIDPPTPFPYINQQSLSWFDDRLICLQNNCQLSPPFTKSIWSMPSNSSTSTSQQSIDDLSGSSSAIVDQHQHHHHQYFGQRDRMTSGDSSSSSTRSLNQQMTRSHDHSTGGNPKMRQQSAEASSKRSSNDISYWNNIDFQLECWENRLLCFATDPTSQLNRASLDASGLYQLLRQLRLLTPPSDSSAAGKRDQDEGNAICCTFCRKNGEPSRIYGTHRSLSRHVLCYFKHSPPFLPSSLSARLFATVAPPSMYVFDRRAKLKQRSRAARNPSTRTYDYIRDQVALSLADRVCDISRHFPVAVDWGCGAGHVARHLEPDCCIDFLYNCDNCSTVLQNYLDDNQQPLSSTDVHQLVNIDQEQFAFRDHSLDLVLSSMSLHWVNDLPGLFRQVLRGLKSDGCFLGVLPASDTLSELRISLQLAELDRRGGLSPHVSPFTDNTDVGHLLSGAGFNLITLDVDELIVHYPSMFHLIDDLHYMGEGNATLTRPLSISRDLLLAAASIYDESFGLAREDGQPGERCVPATLRLLYFIAWKPDPSQPKPLARGSAKYSLKDISRFDELVRTQDAAARKGG